MFPQDYPALPTFPHMSQQPSSSKLGLFLLAAFVLENTSYLSLLSLDCCFLASAASNPASWAGKRVVGGFTGPPIETGATLPYRELSPSRQACMPTASISRSITSGARAPQTQLQALTQAASQPACTLAVQGSAQPAFPAQTSSEARPVSHTSMANHQSSAGQGLLSPAAASASAPSLPPQGPHTTSGSALPSTSPALDSTPAPKPINWSSAASYPKLFMPAQALMLSGTYTATCSQQYSVIIDPSDTPPICLCYPSCLVT